MVRPVSLAAIDRELVRRGGLYAFVKLAWHIAEPGQPFQDNWHIRLICEELEKVSRKETIKLLINIPPGCMKSSLVSVFWPAWEWIDRPQTGWIFASYADSLVSRDAKKMIKILQSSWFVERWGPRLPRKEVKLAELNFESKVLKDGEHKDAGGFRFGTSVRGQLTGRHGDIKVIDDPNKAQDVAGGPLQLPRAAFEEVLNWFQGAWPTRDRNPAETREVVVMQRLHEMDLSGYCLSLGFRHLCIPMRYDPDLAHPQDPRTEKGQLLWPERYPEFYVLDRETRMGPSAAAAQYGQRPSRTGGTIFQLGIWGVKFWAPVESGLVGTVCTVGKGDNKVSGPVFAPPPERGGFQLQSWDMTFKGKDGSDFVAAGVWQVYLNQFWLLYLLNQRLGFVQTLNAMRMVTSRYPLAYDKLIEDKANGPAVEDMIRTEIRGLTLVPPNGGKEARANACSWTFAAGRVILPHPSVNRHTEELISQLQGFPRAKNDDLVDMTTQGLGRVSLHGDLFHRAMAALRGETLTT